MDPNLTIWCNADLSPAAYGELTRGVGGHRMVRPEETGNNLTAGGPSATLDGADVAYGQPNVDQVIQVSSLRWVHLTSAGYTRYDRDDVRAAVEGRHAKLTNSSSVFDEPCAEHLLAFMLAHARRLAGAFSAHGTWAYGELRGRSRILAGDKVLLLGYGAIARRLVELLAPFDVTIAAVRQRVRGDEAVPTFAVGELYRLLGEADHVVDVLPSSPRADGLVDAGAFAAMKPGAAFYNVGRGTTVDQDALIAALASGRLSGAYLDVTTPEPLPEGHPLWSAPNCHITPHIAGGMQDEDLQNVRHFLDNLRRFERGEPLIDVVFG